MGDKHICYDRYSISGCSMFKQFFSAGEVIGQFVERVGEIGSKMNIMIAIDNKKVIWVIIL